MTDIESPAETMRRAAGLLLERADAMDAELRASSYWNSPCTESTPSAEAYRRGVASGLGGASGELAAPWTPEANRALARWLQFEAVNAPGIGEVCLRGGRTAHALAVACAYLGKPSILGEPL